MTWHAGEKKWVVRWRLRTDGGGGVVLRTATFPATEAGALASRSLADSLATSLACFDITRTCRPWVKRNPKRVKGGTGHGPNVAGHAPTRYPSTAPPHPSGRNWKERKWIERQREQGRLTQAQYEALMAPLSVAQNQPYQQPCHQQGHALDRAMGGDA